MHRVEAVDDGHRRVAVLERRLLHRVDELDPLRHVPRDLRLAVPVRYRRRASEGPAPSEQSHTVVIGGTLRMWRGRNQNAYVLR